MVRRLKAKTITIQERCLTYNVKMKFPQKLCLLPQFKLINLWQEKKKILKSFLKIHFIYIYKIEFF